LKGIIIFIGVIVLIAGVVITLYPEEINYTTIHPYLIVGVIVCLIGIITAIIGCEMPESEKVSK
jgi:uncharacterized membrane protein HdeD (DUF308 family)